MKRRFPIIVILAFLSAGCAQRSPYGNLSTLTIDVNLVLDGEKIPAGGAKVEIVESTTKASYIATAGSDGTAEFRVGQGVYHVEAEKDSYSASVDGVIVREGSSRGEVNIKYFKHIADICIKEIYFAGCKALPKEGTYNRDSYFILHNNSAEVQYLDSLCFGTADPYNAGATNVWEGEKYQNIVPVIQAVWQFPGTGKDYPMQPGEDVVVAIYGAIDHSGEYPLSVNLNREDCFVCYNAASFPNVSYHPAPGDRIAADHILNLAIKMGQANAYTFSQRSPALILFRTKDCTFDEFVRRPGVNIQKPSSNTDRIICVPDEWVEDGVEVFGSDETGAKKRLHSTVDASYVTIVYRQDGHTVMRKKDEAASTAAGYEVLTDTNNSRNDFEERERQSLWEEKK